MDVFCRLGIQYAVSTTEIKKAHAYSSHYMYQAVWSDRKFLPFDQGVLHLCIITRIIFFFLV